MTIVEGLLSGLLTDNYSFSGPSTSSFLDRPVSCLETVLFVKTVLFTLLDRPLCNLRTIHFRRPSFFAEFPF